MIRPLDETEALPRRRKLLLLDATNLGHRLFHAQGDLPLAERFGFALNRWRRACEPDFAVAVFDGPGDCWRRKLWPAYKAKRDDDPSKRPSATDWQNMQAECNAARLRWVRVACVEADDLIASYTIAAGRLELDVAIVSSDKDLMQLVRDAPTEVRTIDPGAGKASGPDDVRARWGVWPHALADLLALAGDTSDNFPGVTGIGAKTAAKLINEHGDVEQLLERACLVPGAMGKRLVAQAEQARLCRKLAGLVTDLRLPVAIADAGWKRSAWA